MQVELPGFLAGPAVEGVGVELVVVISATQMVVPSDQIPVGRLLSACSVMSLVSWRLPSESR